MLERPDIPEDLISASLKSEYLIEVSKLDFLPLGYDTQTAVYHLRTQDNANYFLKLRMGSIDPITVEVPYWLNSQGIKTVMAPLPSKEGQLYGRMEDHTIILYPYLPGRDGYEMKLALHHWIELGSTLKKVHSARLPSTLVRLIPTETYCESWRESVKYFQYQVGEKTYHDPVARKLACFMKSKRMEITQLVRRAEELAHRLSRQSAELVLCHSDAHPGNYLIANQGDFYLVDWDNPVYAPKERDLMCIGSGMAGAMPGGWEEQAFYQGYGSTKINLQALAYYRFERIIQDIAEFCKQLLLTSEGGEDREQAYLYFTGSFLPNQVVEVAFETDHLAAQRNQDAL